MHTQELENFGWNTECIKYISYVEDTLLLSEWSLIGKQSTRTNTVRTHCWSKVDHYCTVPTGNTTQNPSTWRVTTMSGENRTLLHEVILYYRSAANIFFNVSATGRGQGLLGSKLIGPAPAGTLSSLSSLTQRRRSEWQWWCSRRLGSGLMSPHLSQTVLALLPRVLSVECYVPWDPPWKVASPWSNTPRALMLAKVLMGLRQGAAVVWKPCLHHSFCFVLAQYHFVFFLSEHSEELTSWDHTEILYLCLKSTSLIHTGKSFPLFSKFRVDL